MLFIFLLPFVYLNVYLHNEIMLRLRECELNGVLNQGTHLVLTKLQTVSQIRLCRNRHEKKNSTNYIYILFFDLKIKC